jgi:hypothetical protein
MALEKGSYIDIVTQNCPGLKTRCSHDWMDLLPQSPGEVDLLELVETGEHTGAGDAAEDVGAGALHEGHEALVLHHLHAAVDGGLVLDGRARGHHHTSPNGVCKKYV